MSQTLQNKKLTHPQFSLFQRAHIRCRCLLPSAHLCDWQPSRHKPCIKEKIIIYRVPVKSGYMGQLDIFYLIQTFRFHHCHHHSVSYLSSSNYPMVSLFHLMPYIFKSKITKYKALNHSFSCNCCIWLQSDKL